MSRATIVEEHSSVLAHWYASGVKAATLVYLDAHLDLQFVEKARIDRLLACKTADQLRMLECRHPFSPDRSACFGIEDFLYPATRLGLISRLVWVAPPHVIRGGIETALRGLLQMEGVTLAELDMFHRTPGGWVEGRLLGLDLVICELPQLSQIPLAEPVLIDIDADFFVRVPDDQVWVQPAQVVRALKALNSSKSMAFELSIARSVGTGFMPLQHRFLADFLAALWEDRQDDVDHWQHLLDQEIYWLNGRRQQALAGLKEAVTRRPQCAACYYALGRIDPNLPSQKTWLAQAAALDPAYDDDLVRRLGEVSARRKGIDPAGVTALLGEVSAFRDTPSREATAWVAMGLICASLGQLDEALECDRRSRHQAGGHPELALELAKLWIGRGEFQTAQALLSRAALDDETRVLAWFYLAECSFALNDFEVARSLASMAHTAAPVWPSVMGRLATYATAAGDSGAGSYWEAQLEETNRRIAEVIARLR